MSAGLAAVADASVPILGVDAASCVTLWNASMVEVTGQSEQSVLGRKLSDVLALSARLSEDSKQQVLASIESALIVTPDVVSTASSSFVASPPVTPSKTRPVSKSMRLQLHTQLGQRLQFQIVSCRNSDGLLTGVLGFGTPPPSAGPSEISSSEPLRQIIDSANVPMFVVDQNSMVTEWNPAAAKIIGWEPQETMGQHFVRTFVTESYREEFGRIIARALQGGETANYEIPFFTKYGWRRELLLNAAPLKNKDGIIKGVIFVGQNITELRKVMADQQRVAEELTALIDTANIPIFSTNVAGDITDWNQQVAEVTGFASSAAISRNFIDDFVTVDAKQSVIEAFQNLVKSDTDAHAEVECKVKDKGGQHVRWMLHAVPRRNSLGKVIGIACFGLDIIQGHTNGLPASKSKDDDLSQVISAAGIPIFGLDQLGRIVSWNRKMVEVSGTEDALGQPFIANFVPQNLHEQIQHLLDAALAGLDTVPVELPLCVATDVQTVLLLHAVRRVTSSGEVLGVLCLCQDITNLKLQLNEAEAMTDDLYRLVEIANAPIFGIDHDLRLTVWNRKAADMTGRYSQDVVGQPLLGNLIAEEYEQDLAQVLECTIRGDSAPSVELEIRTASGHCRQVITNWMPRIESDGTISGAISFGHDVTELRQVAEEHQRMAEDMARLLRSAGAPIFGVDINGFIVEWNDKVASMSGYSKEEVLGRSLGEEFLTAKSALALENTLATAKSSESFVGEFDMRLLSRGGNEVIVSMTASTFRDTSGAVAGILACGQDLTDMKRSIQERVRVAADLTRVIDTADSAIFGVDTEGRITEWNRKAGQICGASREEAMGKPFVDMFIHESYRKAVGDILSKALEGKDVANFNFPLHTKDGERREFLWNATTRRGDCGEVAGIIGIGQDITDLRNALVEQQRIADDWSRFIDTASVPIFGISTDGKVLRWNRKTAELSGFTPEETIGHCLVKEFIREDYKVQVEAVLAKAFQGEETANFEFPMMTKDRKQLSMLLNATPRRDASGHVTGAIAVGQDITKLREAMECSKHIADDLTRVIENTNSPIFGINALGKVTEWNRKSAMITGFSKEEMYNRMFVQDCVAADMQESFREVLKKVLAGEEVSNFDLLLVSKTGEKRHILLNVTPRRGREGDVIGVVAVGQDITALNQQNVEALRIAEELRNIIDTANAPIIGMGRDWTVSEWNCRVSELTGVSKDQALGKEFLSFVLDSCRAEVHRVMTEALAGNPTANLEVMLKSATDDPIVFLLSAAPRLGLEDSILGVICIGQDITQMKELEIKKSHIAATVTHELRSPLHGIIGLSDQLISGGTLGKRTDRSLTMINNCARRLLDLVTNIMDLSTLVQSKRITLARDPVQIPKLVEEVLVLASMAVDKAGRPLQKKTVVLQSTVPDNLPIIQADAHRCLQMLYNLVTNALKFTVEGEVTISASADDEKEIMKILVSDTGIGIAPQYREQIFRPFEQEDQSEGRRYEGLGLGLSISREVAVKHGGNLIVESEVGKGSTFIVTLPYMPQYRNEKDEDYVVLKDDDAVEDPSGQALCKDDAVMAEAAFGFTPARKQPVLEITGRIMVVDDDDVAREAIRKALSKQVGLKVELCVSSHLCMSQLQPGDPPPDLIILDCVMSIGMQGYDVLKWLRVRFSQTQLPVIVVSSEKSPEAAFECIILGCNDYVRKPFSTNDLLTRVAIQLKLKEVRNKEIIASIRSHQASTSSLPSVSFMSEDDRMHKTQLAAMEKPIMQRSAFKAVSTTCLPIIRLPTLEDESPAEKVDETKLKVSALANRFAGRRQSRQAMTCGALPSVCFLLEKDDPGPSREDAISRFEGSMSLTTRSLLRKPSSRIPTQELKPLVAEPASSSKPSVSQDAVADTAQPSSEGFGRQRSSQDDVMQWYQLHSLDCYRLLCRLLPGRAAELTVLGETCPPEEMADVSVLYASMVGWEQAAKQLGSQQATTLLTNLVTTLETLSGAQGIIVTLAPQGCSFLAVAGFDAQPGHEQRLMRFAMSLRDRVRDMMPSSPSINLQASVGIDCGPIFRSVVGRFRPQVCFIGDPVLRATSLSILAGRRRGAAIFISKEISTRLGLSSAGNNAGTVSSGSDLRAVEIYGDELLDPLSVQPSQVAAFALLQQTEILPEVWPIYQKQAPVADVKDGLFQAHLTPDVNMVDAPLPPSTAVCDTGTPRMFSPSPQLLQNMSLHPQRAFTPPRLAFAGQPRATTPRTPSVDRQDGVELWQTVTSLQRRVAHLHFENMQLRARCGTLEPQLHHLVILKTDAEAKAEESQQKARNLELEIQFWRRHMRDQTFVT